jgi:hypothetical protein
MNSSTSISPVVRRRSHAEVAELIRAFEQSNQSLSQFCRQHHIAASTINRHLRRGCRADQTSHSVASSSVSLLPVELVNPQPAKPLFVELPRGLRIAVDPGFDADTLLHLVAVLGGE